MKKIYFASVLHFHQPVGNFEHIFERAYRLCYLPFIRLLLNYPTIQMTFHLSGSLLDYLELKHPEILKFLKKMVSRGQIEMLGGGYYEPIFTAIPLRDLSAQIKMMSDHLKKNFSSSPKGVWIPERVWEPRLAAFLSKLGVRYSILDDAHLLKAGVRKKDICGYFLTSPKFAVFASDETLRYKIPFRKPQETIDYLRLASSGLARKGKEDNTLFVYGDDVEKFGEWPGTYKRVYKQWWLKIFFDLLIKNKDWLKLVKISDYLESNKPQGRLKIPQASYREMMEWAGGSWMNFLAKYPESNQMHKKMCYVSSKIEKLTKRVNPVRNNPLQTDVSPWAGISKGVKKKDQKKLERAKKELYKGQCNCAYWHGFFGGLYLYHLRQAVYSHLIKAEKIADALFSANKKQKLHIKQIDYDLDKKDEIIIENKTFSVYLDPHEGGTIKEFDYKPLSLNLINTLSRKKEPYHKKILKKKLYYDKFPRYSLRDHFIKEELKIEGFMNSSCEELGGFSDRSYTVKRRKEGVLLERKAKVLKTEFKLSKEIKIKSKRKIELIYHLKKYGSLKNNILLGVEFNITMPYLNSPRYRYFFNAIFLGGLSVQGSLSGGVDSFGIVDSQKELDVCFHFSRRPEGIWYFPIMSISRPENDYRVSYQSSCILPRWKPAFNKTNTWTLKIIWEFAQ